MLGYIVFNTRLRRLLEFRLTSNRFSCQFRFRELATSAHIRTYYLRICAEVASSLNLNWQKKRLEVRRNSSKGTPPPPPPPEDVINDRSLRAMIIHKMQKANCDAVLF